MNPDYYAILWISKDATTEEIKKAYRKMAMEHHPDRHGWDTTKEDDFKKINEAYAVLSDPQKKSRYDQYGSAEGRGGGGFGGMGGFDFGDINVEDIFGSVFGNMWGFWQNQRAKKEDGWEDIEVAIKITFAESFSGIKKDISFDRMEFCETCHGNGTKDGKEPKVCPSCRGSGHTTKSTRSIFGMMQQTVICSECRWTGTIIEHPCSECSGKRRVRNKITQTIEIPAGIDDGMTIRMNGEWHAGKHWSGDLYIICQVEQSHDVLIRRESNLYTTVNISPAEAVLGVTKKIKYPILWERQIRIAAWTQHGKKIQLTQEWMPIIGKKWHGDLIITIDILVPHKITKAEKSLYEEIISLEK